MNYRLLLLALPIWLLAFAAVNLPLFPQERIRTPAPVFSDPGFQDVELFLIHMDLKDAQLVLGLIQVKPDIPIMQTNADGTETQVGTRRDWSGRPFEVRYTGNEALTRIRDLMKADLSTNSGQKRLYQMLIQDKKLPSGSTISGSPR